LYNFKVENLLTYFELKQCKNKLIDHMIFFFFTVGIKKKHMQ